MHVAAQSTDDLATIIRWVARIIALFIAIFVAIVVSGEVSSTQYFAGPRVALSAAFLVMWLGLLVAWRSDFWGAMLIIGGTVAYFVLDFLLHGTVLRYWMYGVFLIPGLLLLFCWWRGGHPLDANR